MYIRCEGDTGPHGQQGAIIGPEPLELEEKALNDQEEDKLTTDSKAELVN